MQLNIYVIFDVKAKVYNRPFYLINDDVAIRTLTDLLHDEKSDISKHPSDFVLKKCGIYDDNTGIIEADKPLTLISADELKRDEKNV